MNLSLLAFPQLSEEALYTRMCSINRKQDNHGISSLIPLLPSLQEANVEHVRYPHDQLNRLMQAEHILTFMYPVFIYLAVEKAVFLCNRSNSSC